MIFTTTYISLIAYFRLHEERFMRCGNRSCIDYSNIEHIFDGLDQKAVSQQGHLLLQGAML